MSFKGTFTPCDLSCTIRILGFWHMEISAHATAALHFGCGEI